MYPVTLVGQKVTLREFRADDEDAVLTIVGDDRVNNSPHHRFAQWCGRWGGRGSNPRPEDYESPALTG